MHRSVGRATLSRPSDIELSEQDNAMLNQTQDNFCVVETEAGSQVHISYPLSHLVFEDSFNTTALSMVNISMMNDACIEPSANDVITLSSPVVDVLTPKEAQIYPCVTSRVVLNKLN